MAAPAAPGLTPPEAAFLAEHELVEVIPRQRLESMELLGGPTPALIPPRRASLPLWLALLLKRQQRANISAPAWLHVDALAKILELETELGTERGFTRSVRQPATAAGQLAVSGPFIPTSSSSETSRSNQSTVNGYYNSNSNNNRGSSSLLAEEEEEHEGFGGSLRVALPYHWLEIAHLILADAADDIPDADAVRRLLRDLRETRAAKMRDAVLPALEGGREARVSGIGALEVAEHRLFVTGVVDGLRKIGASKEASRRDREEEEDAARGGVGDDSDDDDDMGM